MIAPVIYEKNALKCNLLLFIIYLINCYFCWDYCCVAVSLENIASDIAELEKGMELTKREYEARKDRDPPSILREFHTNAEEKMRKLKTDCKTAQVSQASNDNHLWLSVTPYLTLT